MSVEGTAIVVLSSIYALFVGVVVYSVRHPEPRRRGSSESSPATFGDLVRHVAVMAAGGYLVFIAVVVVFHVIVAGQRAALASALWGGAFLDFGVAAPLFLLAGWTRGRRTPERR